ncbi:MAG: indole-3-glycerol phosphate synthase TrpC [Alphaproteobacteria bacterium]
MNTLDRIVAARREAVAERKRLVPVEQLRERLSTAPAWRDFRGALAQPGIAVIAEMKRRSPSAGAIRPDANTSEVVRTYAASGARALSILTEPKFFGGRDDDIMAARNEVALPILRKDFIVDPYQIVEARAIGADAVLLMVSVLGYRTGEMLMHANEIGLDALVEVHDRAELMVALAAGARIIGINNRNLKTMQVDLATTEQLAPLVPADVLCIAESGIATRSDIERLRGAGARAFLVGSSLMQAADPGATLGDLIRARAA